MGTIQPRPAHEVRAEALRRAGQKLEQGCIECARGYFALACRNGATETDVRAVLAQIESVTSGMSIPRDAVVPEAARGRVGSAGLKRRDFFKLAGTALAAGVAAQFIAPRIARASSVTDSTPAYGYFGVDSCTAPEVGSIAGMPMNFYIAELGATTNGIGCFNSDTARQVGEEYTHSYWGFCGPTMAPPVGTLPAPTSPLLPSYSPYAAYGVAQARTAIAAWNSTPGIAGTTIFADIEAGFGGWGDETTSLQCAHLLDGFLVTIAEAGFVPGVYIANWARDTWFAPDYHAAVPFVYWVAGGPAAGQMCAPCEEGCYTLGDVTALWNQQVQQETFAGMSPILWQYWPSDLGCGGDYNFSPQSGKGAFTPGPIPQQ